MQERVGCDVITDHHLPRQLAAGACSRQPQSTRLGSYPDKARWRWSSLKLCWATATVLAGSTTVTARQIEPLLEQLALVALGTIADCAPLSGENRILVHHGLHALHESNSPGLVALREQAALITSQRQKTSAGKSHRY